jgi:cytochrome c
MIVFVPLFLCLGLAQLPAAPHRARDPWVFRSVLDKKPRMVTFALSDEMWAAYDAESCALYKAWKGGVHFDGAVYTTVHGPQPTSAGDAYTLGVEGSPWEIFVDDKKVETRVQWKGYVFHDGRCTMNYEFGLPDGRWVGVLETPEFVTAKDLFDESQREGWSLTERQPGLLRSFLASDLPPDVKITLAVNTDHAVGKFCEVEERAETVETKTAGGVLAKHSVLHVVLTAANRSNNLILFFPPIADAKIPPAPDAHSGGQK